MNTIHVPEADRPLAVRQKEAEQLVDAVPLLEPWGDERANRKVLFNLHRALLGLGGQPEDYQTAVTRLAERQSSDEWNEATLWEFFVSDWETIKWPKGRNWIREAYELALKEPVPFPSTVKARSKNIEILYAMCHHLAAHNAPEPFELSRRLIGEVFGMSKMGASDMVKRLVRNKLIQPLNQKGQAAVDHKDEFYVATERNKRYRLIRPQPLPK